MRSTNNKKMNAFTLIALNTIFKNISSEHSEEFLAYRVWTPTDYLILPNCSPNSWANSCSSCQCIRISIAPHSRQLQHFYQSGGCERGANGISLFTFYYPLGWEPFSCVYWPFVIALLFIYFAYSSTEFWYH